MTPEVWDCIKRDWKQSLPSVLNGTCQIYDIGEDPDYPYGWARDRARPKSMTITIHYVADIMGFSMEEIEGRRGNKWLCRARSMIYLIVCKRFPGCSLSEIGLRVDKDHTTVTHGLSAAKLRLREDREFREIYESICMEFGI